MSKKKVVVKRPRASGESPPPPPPPNNVPWALKTKQGARPQKTGTPVRQFTVDLPTPLHKRLAVYAARTDATQRAVLEAALEAFLTGHGG